MSLPINGLTFVLSHFQSIWVCKILCDINMNDMSMRSKYLPSKQVQLETLNGRMFENIVENIGIKVVQEQI